MPKTDNFFAEDGLDHRDLRFVPADPATARTLTSGQVEAFNRDGFLGPLPVFDDVEAKQWRSYFDELIDAVVSADDQRNPYSINAYHMVCAGLYDLVLTPRILDYVEDIIGPSIVSWGTHMFCKLPGDLKDVPMHQDALYWPFSPTRSVTAWYAIDDTDESNGAMTFAPGSHLGGPLAHEQLPLDGTRVLNHAARHADAFADRYVNALPAGSISLHTDMLLHGSPPNHSRRRRAGMTIRYSASGVSVVPGWEHWIKPTIRCRGEAPDYWGDWRRPDGEHPEKMAAFSGGFDGTPVPNAG